MGVCLCVSVCVKECVFVCRSVLCVFVVERIDCVRSGGRWCVVVCTPRNIMYRRKAEISAQVTHTHPRDRSSFPEHLSDNGLRPSPLRPGTGGEDGEDI